MVKNLPEPQVLVFPQQQVTFETKEISDLKNRLESLQQEKQNLQDNYDILVQAKESLAHEFEEQISTSLNIKAELQQVAVDLQK